jgi:hypothetical protein
MKTKHVLLVDLPQGPADIGAEIETVIWFVHVPQPIDHLVFVAAEPTEPFSGTFADRMHEHLEEIAEDWLDSETGQNEATEQIVVDRSIAGEE